MYGLHQGYSYQDLLTAFLISENLNKKDLLVGVEYKECGTDFFDDIIIIADERKTKYQIKHSSVAQPIEEINFTSNTSDLCLTNLQKSFLSKDNSTYIIATNRPVVGDTFFIPSKKLKTFSFQGKAFTLYVKGSYNKSFIKRLIIETELPSASFNLNKPGSLEKELLESLRFKVGIGYYPNAQISVRDVAGRLILLANTLRNTKVSQLVDRDYIFKYIDLNFEFGHIIQNFPFISPQHRLFRKKVVESIQNSIIRYKFYVLEGSPGSGKSHIFDDLYNRLVQNGICVARHFCYIEPTDQFIQERILIDTVYGNFFHQLEKIEPELTQKITPYFAASRTKLEKLLDEISKSGKNIVLMVDGLDHINRVVAQNKLSPNLINNFISELLEINLPEGCTIFIASQPSTDLTKIVKQKKADVYLLEQWDEMLVKEFVSKHNNYLPFERKLVVNDQAIKLLTEKTEGNPLYLTYILNDILSEPAPVNILSYVDHLPQLNDNLNNYYAYLSNDISDNDFAIMQTLALLDFSVTGHELGKMFPPIQKKVIESTLKKIKPILKPGIVQGGIRIYHESFRRYVIELGYNDKGHNGDIYQHIISWLQNEDFYISQRAYRYLIPYLLKSESESNVYQYLTKDFVAKSLYYFHSVESIISNLNKIAGYSARQLHWDMYCKAVELRRAIHTYSEERYNSVDELYHQAALNTLGAEMFCERLVFDGEPTFSKPYGACLCKIAEHAGGKPPWNYYDVSGLSMQISGDEQISYFQEVESAHFLSKIRNSSVNEALVILKKLITKNKFPNTEQNQIALLLNEFDFVFGVVANHKGLSELNLSHKKKLTLEINVAGYLYSGGYKSKARKIANSVLSKTKDKSLIIKGLKYGGSKKNVKISEDLAKLTNQILKVKSIYTEEIPIFQNWYQSLYILCHTDPQKVKETIKSITHIYGWFRAWILFLFKLFLLEASKHSIRKKEVTLQEILTELSIHTHPFVGQPRAMDLYSIRNFSHDSFAKALSMAKNFSNWSKILNLLSNISKETTSYLQGSSGGPLTGEEFNTILKDVYPSLNEANKAYVKKLFEENAIYGISTSVYYDSAAVEFLKLTLVLSEDKKVDKARKSFMDACIRLSAYGHRKDITLFEVVDPLNFLAKKYSKSAMSNFHKTYPLVEIVNRNTDKSSTQHGLVVWLKKLIDSSILIAVQTIIELINRRSGIDWRIEAGIENLCGKLLNQNISPVTIAELYNTINFNDPDFKVTTPIQIIEALLKINQKEGAQKLFSFLCRTVYRISTDRYIYDKEIFGVLLSFANKNGLEINSSYISHFRAERDKLKNSSNSSKSKLRERAKKVPKYNFSKMSLTDIRQLIENNSPSHFFHPNNMVKFSEILIKFSDLHLNEVKDLISLLIMQGLRNEESTNGLIALKNIMLKKQQTQLAAFISMLGFVYSRGGDGWFALADSKYNYLYKEAIAISKKVALTTLSEEMSKMFNNSGYFIGPVKHFIELFCSLKKISSAQNIWDKAYDVIKFRLPVNSKLEEQLKAISPSFNYNQSTSLKKLLIQLIQLRKRNYFL